MAESPLATVAILTYNGEQYLRGILEAVAAQVIEGEVEVLVIDSGSTDSTLDIVKDFPDVVLHEIPNEEFGHGRTRNLAARIAKGHYIAFLTHDAIPIDSYWLKELLAPFELNYRVVGVMGKQVPRASCNPLMKYEIRAVFRQFGPDFGSTLFYNGDFVRDEGTRAAISFYSDVNSAARRSFLVDSIPYRDVAYAEDQMFGQDLIEAGWMKAYAPRAAVEHSNDVTYSEFGARIFDETVGLRRIGTVPPPLSRSGLLRAVVRGSLSDAPQIVRDGQWGRKRRLYWLVINPFFHLKKWTSYRKAITADLDDEESIRSNSLEHRRKK
jgi:rhamnosyltransferase